MPERPEAAIELTDVGVRYRLASLQRPSIKQFAVAWAAGGLRYRSFWALRGVSLRVARGEGVVVVGRNGAGKSTLLKVLSGVLEPTTGRASITGRIGAIHEAGAAFDFEMSGVENIYLAGLLMGRTRREVDGSLDRIVAFSGLGDFVDSPLRNYSSGMVARLSFSVSVAWPVDTLLIDEVLAVGDAGFRQRCAERLSEMRHGGLSLVVVSHQPESLLGVCSRCVWMEDGSVRADGPIGEVLEAYAASAASPELKDARG